VTIAEGPPETVANNARVIEAYLGTSRAVASSSGSTDTGRPSWRGPSRS
jgi:hypothetical protein